MRAASAQAWSPRQGQGGVTFAAQTIDHVGRMVDDGTRFACCGSTNVALYIEFDYGLTNRLSISGGMPYVFAKYRGDAPFGPAAFLPYPELDSCHCVHSSFQDFGFAARYNVTPGSTLVIRHGGRLVRHPVARLRYRPKSGWLWPQGAGVRR